MDLTLNGTSLYLETGGATFTTAVDSVLNDNRQIYKTRERWTVQVRIHPDQSAVTPQQRQDSIVSKVATLEGAINTTGLNNLSLTTDSGSEADIISGALLLSGPNFGGDQPGENALFRRVSMTFEREANGATSFANYTETVSYFGGGPRKAIQEIRNGQPIEYQVSQATPFGAIQVGSAVNRISPYVPSPYWPDRIINPESSSTTRGSRNVDGYPSSWNYSFASPTSFPTIVPARPGF